MPKYNKYDLYERSVQSPKDDIQLFASIYRNLRHEEPRRFREDFCGTFAMACAWVKANPKNTALGLDIDDEPLASGRERHYSKLTPAQRRRLRILRQNVISVTKPKTDLIVANNFSFYIFKKRKDLLRYMRACYASLAPNGIVVLEMAGGPGMVEKSKETRTIYDTRGNKKCLYIWDQKYFDPITHDARYAIHFKFPDGSMAKDAFTYDWRLWTLPEVMDVMREAGFPQTRVFWENEDETEYLPMERGTNEWSWLAYAVGMK